MRTAKMTGTSKRAAQEMMGEAIIQAAVPLGPARMADAQAYRRQLTAGYLTQDQMTAVECLIDIAFEGGKAAAESERAKLAADGCTLPELKPTCGSCGHEVGYDDT